MVMFLLSFVKGVQIRGGESISASGYGPGGSISASGFGPGGPILGGSKSAGTPEQSYHILRIYFNSNEISTRLIDNQTHETKKEVNFEHINAPRQWK